MCIRDRANAESDELSSDGADEEPGVDGMVLDADAPPKRLKLSRIPKMAKRARNMLERALAAYMERDADKAMGIVKRDRKINRQYRKFFAEAMAELSRESVVEIPTYLLWIAHNLERIGDRTTNMAERTVFMVTAQYTEAVSYTHLDVYKRQASSLPCPQPCATRATAIAKAWPTCCAH